MALSNARSCGLKIRSSCSNVWEKESRTCFGVMADTPPCVERIGLGNPHCRGSSTDNTTSKRESPRKFLREEVKRGGCVADYRVTSADTMDWRIFTPSVPPNSGSAERSG